jgi:hypothetical protein
MKYTYDDIARNFISLATGTKKFEINNVMLGSLWSIYARYISFMNNDIETKLIKAGDNKLNILRGGEYIARDIPDEITEYEHKKLNPYLQSEIKTHALDSATGKKLPVDMLREVGSYLGGSRRAVSRCIKTKRTKKSIRNKKTKTSSRRITKTKRNVRRRH